MVPSAAPTRVAGGGWGACTHEQARPFKVKPVVINTPQWAGQRRGSIPLMAVEPSVNVRATGGRAGGCFNRHRERR